MTGDFRGASSPSMTCKSVRHTAHTSTRTRISPGPGTGFGNSPHCKGLVSTAEGVRRKQAFMLSPLADLPRTPGIRRPTHVFSKPYTKGPRKKRHTATLQAPYYFGSG